MKLLTASSEQKIEIVDGYAVGLSVRHNPFAMPLESLFSMAMRKNPKRQFLFVSRLIGKHIPISPQIVSIAGGLLAELFTRRVTGKSILDGQLLADALSDRSLLDDAMRAVETAALPVSCPTLFIGFAETATGLAQAVFRPFSGCSAFAHTTRVPIEDRAPALRFCEEHSHATSHLCYFGPDARLTAAERIVLIDDEITTGKTTLNFIAALLKIAPAREFAILSILDWRSKEQRQSYRAFEEAYGVKITCVSLLSGGIAVPPYSAPPISVLSQPVAGAAAPHQDSLNLSLGEPVYCRVNGQERAFSPLTGRFGITAENMRAQLGAVKTAGARLGALRQFDSTLCLGTGELIYLPSLLAERMGEGCLYGSTTLSPILSSDHAGYPVQNDITYTGEAGCGDAGALYHIYNLLPEQCPEVFFFTEQEMEPHAKAEITQKLTLCAVKHLVFVSLT